MQNKQIMRNLLTDGERKSSRIKLMLGTKKHNLGAFQFWEENAAKKQPGRLVNCGKFERCWLKINKRAICLQVKK